MTGSDPGSRALPEDDVALATAEEILGYAEEEFRKAVKTGDILLYRNAVEKAFLAMVLAVNSYIKMKLNIIAKSHAEEVSTQTDWTRRPKSDVQRYNEDTTR